MGGATAPPPAPPLATLLRTGTNQFALVTLVAYISTSFIESEERSSFLRQIKACSLISLIIAVHNSKGFPIAASLVHLNLFLS